MPKKGFSFKKGANKKKPEEKKVAPVKKETAVNNHIDDNTHLMVKDTYMMDISLKKEDYEGKENVIIENAQDSNIYIPFVVKCIYVKNVGSCSIYASAV